VLDTPIVNRLGRAPALALSDGRYLSGTIGGRLKSWWRIVWRATTLVACLSPTLVAIVYFGFFASDRYVSEARFVVKTAARPNIGGGLASLLQMTGITRAQDDTFAVQDFIMSRGAVAAMPDTVDLRKIYGRDDADRFTRYPNWYYGASEEELFRYLTGMIAVVYNPNTSISTLTVQAFTPQDAQTVALALLDMSETIINRINTRIRDDSVRLAADEVKNAEERVIAAQLAITTFRNREMMIDPARNSIIVTELVGRLSAELSETRATITEMTASSPDNPQIASLSRRAAALEAQIVTERSRITTASDGLADKIAIYERLVIEKEFAARLLSLAIIALETSRTEARRQQLYLQRVVEPSLPDYPLKPERGFTIFAITAANLIALLIIWLMRMGVGSHGFSMGKRN
jgi:capsular polysaccharide transport system permease protein